jgi:hypothetical protein
MCRTGRPAKVPKMSKPQAKFIVTKDKLPTTHSSHPPTNSNKSSLKNRGAKHLRSLLDFIFSQQMEADKNVTPILLGS